MLRRGASRRFMVGGTALRLAVSSFAGFAGKEAFLDPVGRGPGAGVHAAILAGRGVQAAAAGERHRRNRRWVSFSCEFSDEHSHGAGFRGTMFTLRTSPLTIQRHRP
jgi:hypothetical protein